MASETMKVKFTEDYKSGGESFYKDDIRTLPYAFGERMVKNGFAEDQSGEVPTGEKPTGPKRIKPDDVFTKGS